MKQKKSSIIEKSMETFLEIQPFPSDLLNLKNICLPGTVAWFFGGWIWAPQTLKTQKMQVEPV